MIDAIIHGKLHKKPVARTSSNGNPFVTASVRVSVDNGDAMFASVIAFDKSACMALAALDDGDTVALSGSLTPKVWTPKEGDPRPAIDFVAHVVTTAYHVKRKRQAMTE